MHFCTQLLCDIETANTASLWNNLKIYFFHLPLRNELDSLWNPIDAEQRQRNWSDWKRLMAKHTNGKRRKEEIKHKAWGVVTESGVGENCKSWWTQSTQVGREQNCDDSFYTENFSEWMIEAHTPLFCLVKSNGHFSKLSKQWLLKKERNQLFMILRAT